ncbi:hypothetical protein [Parapedobacter defluvii]|nr:hypothetical protein [Parapedobacter defluvii]
MIISLSSCQNGSKNSAEKTDTQTSVNDTLVSTEKTEAVIPFPQNVNILLPTQYRKESTGYPKNVKDKDWYEIYKDPKTEQWNIGKVELKITYGRDECVGEDVMIIKSQHEDAVLFFTPFEGLSANPVTVLEDKMLFPEHDVSFSFDGKEYHLSPVGSCLDENGQIMTIDELRAKTNEELNNNTKISGYRLFFGNAEKSPELAVVENIEYANPTLVWAGDLNNDGLPDLILDLSEFYECQHLYFFLSDKNDQEKPLKKVADLLIVNDC